MRINSSLLLYTANAYIHTQAHGLKIYVRNESLGKKSSRKQIHTD